VLGGRGRDVHDGRVRRRRTRRAAPLRPGGAHRPRPRPLAVAAIKSGARGRADVTSGLLSRGYERIGLAPAQDAGLAELITKLAESCADLEPTLTSMATEVREVARALLPPSPGTGQVHRRTGADLRAALEGTVPPDDGFTKDISAAVGMATEAPDPGTGACS
jgi:hypothetical protein